MSKKTIEIPLVKATYEELQQVICELQVERYKYKIVLDKIKEWVLYQQKSNENLEPYISTDKLDEILKLLEEIE